MAISSIPNQLDQRLDRARTVGGDSGGHVDGGDRFDEIWISDARSEQDDVPRARQRRARHDRTDDIRTQAIGKFTTRLEIIRYELGSLDSEGSGVIEGQLGEIVHIDPQRPRPHADGEHLGVRPQIVCSHQLGHGADGVLAEILGRLDFCPPVVPRALGSRYDT